MIKLRQRVHGIQPNLVWLLAFSIAIFIGFYFRLQRYLENRSLWIDEIVNATNVLNKSLAQLILLPMEYNLTAPRGFWTVERLIVRLLGGSEYALRLYPLICGLVSLALFYWIAKRYVSAKTALVALSLFAISHPLIAFSAELKQYSSDVLVTLLLLWLAAFGVARAQNGRRIMLIGAMGAAAIWFSYPAVFVLGSIGLSFIFADYARARRTRMIGLCVVILMWGTSFVVMYVNSLAGVASNNVLAYQWASGYMPFPLLSLSDWKWLLDHFLAMFDNPVGIASTGAAALAFLLGCASLLSRSKTKFIVLVLPFFLLIAASALRRYPFDGRVLVFLAPIVLILVAEGLMRFGDSVPGKVSLQGMLLFGLVFASTLTNPIILTPHEEIQPVMSRLRGEYRDGDLVYLYYGANLAYRYYASNLGLASVEHISGSSARDNWTDYGKQVEQLRGHGRVWVVFSHVWVANGVDEGKFFLYLLDEMGTRMDTYQAPGAALYLYDMRK